jgi:long-chain acyl-CoA synthetase
MNLTRWAAADPDRVAYLVAGTGDHITRGELEARSNQVAHLFRSLGLRAGDHVALMYENGLDLLVAVWAAQRTGLAPHR